LHQDILNAREKGISVFILDAESITDGAYGITSDHRQWAVTSLEWMFEKMDGQGDFAYYDFQPDSNHTEIIEDTLKKYPGIKVENDKGYLPEGQDYSISFSPGMYGIRPLR
jgi:ABC-type sugar transport system substrate-binding protein